MEKHGKPFENMKTTLQVKCVPGNIQTPTVASPTNTPLWKTRRKFIQNCREFAIIKKANHKYPRTNWICSAISNNMLHSNDK